MLKLTLKLIFERSSKASVELKWRDIRTFWLARIQLEDSQYVRGI